MTCAMVWPLLWIAESRGWAASWVNWLCTSLDGMRSPFTMTSIRDSLWFRIIQTDYFFLSHTHTHKHTTFLVKINYCTLLITIIPPSISPISQKLERDSSQGQDKIIRRLIHTNKSRKLHHDVVKKACHQNRPLNHFCFSLLLFSVIWSLFLTIIQSSYCLNVMA